MVANRLYLGNDSTINLRYLSAEAWNHHVDTVDFASGDVAAPFNGDLTGVPHVAVSHIRDELDLGQNDARTEETPLTHFQILWTIP